MQKIFRDPEELETEAVIFLHTLTPRSQATLVTLSGELGAGKTTFVQYVARALGIKEQITSPTFVLEKTYALPSETGHGFARLVHIDAYRLESADELRGLAFDELMDDPDNLIMLEWPERVHDTLPPPASAIALSLNADGSRTLTYA